MGTSLKDQRSYRKKVSLLELLHPDGRASTSFVLGGNCPENLLPESSIPTGQGTELIILAPTTTECRTQGWLDNATALVAQHLLNDGFCYMLVPPSWRFKVLRLLARENLTIDAAFWHFPDWSSSHYLVPLQQGSATFAVDNIISAPWWKRIFAKTIFRYRKADKLLSVFWKPVGLSVRRPKAHPLFQWVFPQDQGTAIIRRSWRYSYGAEILYTFKQSDAQPSTVIKTAASEISSARLDREAEVLDLLGAGIRASGAQSPRVLRRQAIGGRSALFLSPIEGRSASDLLASHPELLVPVFNKIVGWLERWHVTTLRVQSSAVEQLERSIFTPVDQLAPSLDHVERYRNRLSKHISSASESRLPLVATHNDLTMANVLIDDQIGVVDWETGMEESWPLVDFYYSVTDAVRIARRYPSWLDAFKACYEPDGPYRSNVQCWEQQLRSAVGTSSCFSELCFHACWLHHAANEQKVSRPGDELPFLQIVQRLTHSIS